jgi:hypothetical protein
MQSVGAGMVVPRITTFFFSQFYIGGHTGCYVGGLSELYHMCDMLPIEVKNRIFIQQINK